MGIKAYPVIDLVATGNNIRRLRMERGLTVRDLQSYFGFEEPRAIYKWQKGECPSHQGVRRGRGKQRPASHTDRETHSSYSGSVDSHIR